MRLPSMIVAVLLPLLLAGSSCTLAQKAPDPPARTQESKESTRNGWLGVSIADMTGAKAREMNTTTKRGTLITGVTEDSPAEKAGIKEDDIITSFNGKSIEEAEDLFQAVRTSAPGSKASIVIVRKDGSTTLQATIGKLPRSQESFSRLAVPIPRIHVRIPGQAGGYGLDLMDLNSQLAEYFDAPNGRGVLVERVGKRSPAEKSGFKAGDVILTVGKENVEEPGDIRAILNDCREGDTVAFGILRKGARKTLSMEMEDRGFGGEIFRFRSNHDLEHLHEIEETSFNRQHLEFNRQLLDQQMNKLKLELKNIGREVQSKMRDVRDQLRRELREVSG